MAVDDTKVTQIQLKVSNPYANGRMVIFSDGTGKLVRDFVNYVPNETDEYYTVKIGDVITRIAYKFYRDKVSLPSHYWWIIADANGIKNPLDLSEWKGKELVIPNVLNFKLSNQ